MIGDLKAEIKKAEGDSKLNQVLLVLNGLFLLTGANMAYNSWALLGPTTQTLTIASGVAISGVSLIKLKQQFNLQDIEKELQHSMNMLLEWEETCIHACSNDSVIPFVSQNPYPSNDVTSQPLFK